MPTALVTDAELLSSLAVIRSLGRRGWRVVATSSHAGAIGLRSRFASTRLHLVGHDNQDQVADHLLSAVRDHAVDVVVPVTDETLLSVLPVRDALPATCRLATADSHAVNATMDKAATVALARRLAIPTPDTIVVRRPPDVSASTTGLGWPVVVKPQFSRVRAPDHRFARFVTSYALDDRQLRDQIAAVDGRCDILLQRYHRGEGVGVCLLLWEGRPLAAFQHRRLREVPPSGGGSALRESASLDPQLYDYSLRLLGALRWTGLAMAEFKMSEEGPLMLEVNGRIWGSLPLAVSAGMDFPAKLAELFLTGPPIQPAVDMSYGIGVRARVLELEIEWIKAVLRGRQQPPVGPPIPRTAAAWALVDLFRPSYHTDAYAKDDIRPALRDIGRLTRQLGGSLGKRVCPGRAASPTP